MAVDTDSVRDRFDIVDIISGYVDIKKAGKNYQGCCPFHDEKSPSFTVAQDKQFYHCFGCGAHGDVIDFVMEINRVEFIDAIKILDSSLLNDYSVPVTEYKKEIRPRFYLGQSKNDSVDSILNNCEQINSCYFSGGNQVLPLVSVSGDIVCLALITGKGFDIRFLGKALIYGSFYVLGNNEKPIVLVSDYHLALSVNCGNYCVICIFDALNLFYVVAELKRVGASFDFLCSSSEDFIQAEKMHIHKIFNKSIGNYVITDEYLNGEL